MVVLTRARQYHRVVVVRWDPRITGPATTGSMLEIYSKEEHVKYDEARGRLLTIELFFSLSKGSGLFIFER